MNLGSRRTLVYLIGAFLLSYSQNYHRFTRLKCFQNIQIIHSCAHICIQHLFSVYSFFSLFIVWCSKGYFEMNPLSMKLVVLTKVLKNCGMEKYEMQITFDEARDVIWHWILISDANCRNVLTFVLSEDNHPSTLGFYVNPHIWLYEQKENLTHSLIVYETFSKFDPIYEFIVLSEAKQTEKNCSNLLSIKKVDYN